MVTFPNSKINLGLNILRKRTDGFHDIESVFLPIPLYDVLEIIKKDETESVSFTSSGINIPGKTEENTCVKAYNILRHNYNEIEPVQVHLHKIIPTGGGLGGGSSNGAYMLKLLNRYFNLQIGDDELKKYALQLGSDCPFFISSEAAFATGRGEVLKPINVDLTDYRITIINPGIHINTSEMFGKISPASPDYTLLENIHLPPEEWTNKIKNDFEPIAFELYPDLKAIKEKLISDGAVYSSLSGSGSTIYGIFKKRTMPKTYFKNYFSFSFDL